MEVNPRLFKDHLLDSGVLDESVSNLTSSSRFVVAPDDDDDDDSSEEMRSRASTIRNGVLVATVGYAQVIVCGQILSFLLAASGAASASLYLECDIAVPGLSTLGMFSCLALFMIPLSLRSKRWAELMNEAERRGKHVEKPQYSLCGISLFASVFAYFLIGLVNAVSDYVNVLSFRYTTLTSNTVFQSLSVPAAMVLSRLFLDREYKLNHYVGATICITGVLVNVLMDYHSDTNSDRTYNQGGDYSNYQGASGNSKDENAGAGADDFYSFPKDVDIEETFFDYDEEAYPYRVLGDILAIVGGILYGAIDVMAEYSARHFGGPMEFLAMVGLWGILFSVPSILATEMPEVQELLEGSSNGLCSPTDSFWLIMTFVITMTLHIIGVSYFVLFSESAILNMSLLTGNFWAVGFQIIYQNIVPEPVFYVALFLIILGIVVYEGIPSPIPEGELPAIKSLLSPGTMEDLSSFDIPLEEITAHCSDRRVII